MSFMNTYQNIIISSLNLLKVFLWSAKPGHGSCPVRLVLDEGVPPVVHVIKYFCPSLMLNQNKLGCWYTACFLKELKIYTLGRNIP
jgi:hypothetical protein